MRRARVEASARRRLEVDAIELRPASVAALEELEAEDPMRLLVDWRNADALGVQQAFGASCELPDRSGLAAAIVGLRPSGASHKSANVSRATLREDILRPARRARVARSGAPAKAPLASGA